MMHIQQALTCKGRFILATNQLDTEHLPDQALFDYYKDQQSVERGFRFLKDPWFMDQVPNVGVKMAIPMLPLLNPLCE